MESLIIVLPILLGTYLMISIYQAVIEHKDKANREFCKRASIDHLNMLSAELGTLGWARLQVEATKLLDECLASIQRKEMDIAERPVDEKWKSTLSKIVSERRAGEGTLVIADVYPMLVDRDQDCGVRIYTHCSIAERTKDQMPREVSGSIGKLVAEIVATVDMNKGFVVLTDVCEANDLDAITSMMPTET